MRTGTHLEMSRRQLLAGTGRIAGLALLVGGTAARALQTAPASTPASTPAPAGDAALAGLKCDVAELNGADVALRESLEYVDLSPFGAIKDCRNCSYWVPAPTPAACGGCTIMRGQVHPLGYCTSWEPA